MSSDQVGICEVCGKQSSFHLTENRDGEMTSHEFCTEHTPIEFRHMPAERIAILRRMIAAFEQQVADPAMRSMYKAEIEQEIAELESGQNAGDPDE